MRMSSAIFVDTNSMYLTTRDMGVNRVNYDKLFDLLRERGLFDENTIKHAYGVQVNKMSKPFIYYLEATGFITYFVNVMIQNGPRKDALHLQNTDIAVKMASDILLNASVADTFIIVTVNPTFHNVLHELELLGKKVILVVINEVKRLEEYASEVIRMDQTYFEDENSVSARQQRTNLQ